MHMVWEFTCDLWTMNNPESGKMLSPYQISCAYIFTLLFFLNLENAQIHRGHKKSFLLKMWSKNNDQELLHWTEIWIQWWKWKWKKLALFYCLWMAMAHTNCFRTHYDRLPIRITIFRLNLQKWKEFARKQIMYLEFIFDKNRTIENYWIINVNQSSE